jgi:hypothetical protein
MPFVDGHIDPCSHQDRFARGVDGVGPKRMHFTTFAFARISCQLRRRLPVAQRYLKEKVIIVFVP